MLPSELFEGGGVRTGAAVFQVPTKFGFEPLHDEYQPGSTALTSIVSFAVRPKVGVPQIEMASFECSGPLIVSAVMNEILLQKSPFVFGIAWL